MQDKIPIIVYEEDDTHIKDLLLNFIDKFGSQLIDENKIRFKSYEPFSPKTVAQSQKIVNQSDFCVSIRRNKNET